MMIILIICLVFLGAKLAIDLSIHATSFNRVDAFSSHTDSVEHVAVMVVVKNDELALQQLIPDLANQKGLDFNVVLVNDHSEDGSLNLMQKTAEQDKRFTCIDVQNPDYRGKKHALHYAMEHTTCNLVVLTDADCRIKDEWWLHKMVKGLEHSDVCLGSGLYPLTGRFFARLHALDTLRMHTLFHSTASWGFPYMAVGRSMAMRRNAYLSSSAKPAYWSTPFGTDDLLVQAAYSAGKRIASLPNAVTWSFSPKNWSDWIRQRRRHTAVANQYPHWALMLIASYELLTMLTPLLILVSFLSMTLLGGTLLIICLISLGFTLSIRKTFMEMIGVTKGYDQLWRDELVVSYLNALNSTLGTLIIQPSWPKRR